MDTHATLPIETELTITLPQELQRQVHLIAARHGDTPSDVICMAVASYITANFKEHHHVSKKIGLDEARRVMRELGQGLGAGQPPHNGARHHDTYLYGEKQNASDIY